MPYIKMLRATRSPFATNVKPELFIRDFMDEFWEEVTREELDFIKERINNSSDCIILIERSDSVVQSYKDRFKESKKRCQDENIAAPCTDTSAILETTANVDTSTIKTPEEIKREKKREKDRRYRANKKAKEAAKETVLVSNEFKQAILPYSFGFYDIVDAIRQETNPNLITLTLTHKTRKDEPRTLVLNTETDKFLEKDIDFTGLHVKTHEHLIKQLSDKLKGI